MNTVDSLGDNGTVLQCDVFTDDSLKRSLSVWLAEFTSDPLRVKLACDEWHQEARRVLEARWADSTELDADMEWRFRMMTNVLSVWCNHHPTARIDPTPLLGFLEVALAWAFCRGTRHGERWIEKSEFVETYDRAACVTRQIELAATVSQERKNTNG